MKSVIVLGANGFLGSKLANTLAARGCSVLAMVDGRFPYEHLKHIDRIRTIEFSLSRLEDLNDYPDFNSVDTLYNMAWSGVNALSRNEAEEQAQNILYGLKVMAFAKHHNIKKIIVPGSASEVSCGGSTITGREIPAPSDMYSAAKVATRYVCQTYADQHDIELIWTLITSVYGPGRNDNNLISYTIQSLLKGEKPQYTKLEQKWDYLYIDDLMNAFFLLGEKGIGGKVYPIGSGIYHRMRDYVEKIRDLINPSAELGIGTLPYKKKNVIDNQMMDITELQKDTGFVPKVSFADGIVEVIKYFKNV